MDNPDLSTDLHIDAMRGLKRINRASGVVRRYWSRLLPLLSERGRLTVLDVATGAGDIPIGLWQMSQRCGYDLEISGCDCSPRSVEFSQQNAKQLNAGVEFYQLDTLVDPIPKQYDVVLCSLFMHHLDNEGARKVLGRLATAVGRLLLINDLRRGRFGWLVSLIGSRLLSRSPVVHTDALLSVEAAFTVAEIRELALTVGLEEVEIERCWPFRWLLSWSRA